FLSLSCGSRAVVSAKQDGDRHVVRLALSVDPRFLDPHRAGDVYSGRQCGLVYDSLVDYQYPSPLEPQLVPCLARRMPEITDGGKTYTFTLRDDIFFQDDPCFPNGVGRKVTARDAIYSLKRLMSLPQGGFWVLENKVLGLDDWRSRFLATTDPQTREQLFDEPVGGLPILDEYTFQIRLLSPYPQLLWALSLPYGAIVPREAAVRYGPDFSRHPVGTGPFILKEYVKKQHLIWTRNPKYREHFFPQLDSSDMQQDHYKETLRLKWEQQGALEPKDWDRYIAPHIGKRMPLADEIQFLIIPEASTMWMEFLAGTIDCYERINKEQFDRAFVGTANSNNSTASPDELLAREIRDQGIHLQICDDPSITYLVFNMEDELVGGYDERHKKLRKAISLCMDRAYLISTHLNGRGRLANMLIPPGVRGFDPDCRTSWGVYDPQHARDLLQEAGYSVSRDSSGEWVTRESPDGPPLELSVEFRSAIQGTRDIARFYTICAQEIGIRLQCNLQTFPEFLRRASEGKGQLYDANWTMDYPDSQNVLQLLYGPNRRPGVNYAAYRNDRYDRLYEELQVLSDSIPEEWQRKSEIIWEMLKIIDEDTPWIYLYYNRPFVLYHDWFSPTKPIPMSTREYRYTTSDPNRRRDKVEDRNAIFWPPGILFVLVFLAIVGAFVYKIVDQQQG
ncbi:MAG TPA: ABC transporter substrate-binding protein, partial [bacterium]|nr:ABC transporter substrate-binding protein [bacterium]